MKVPGVLTGLGHGLYRRYMKWIHLFVPGGEKMRIIAFIEDYKIVKKILDYLRIYEFERKRPPPKVYAAPDEFDGYIWNDYIDFDHVCWGNYRVAGYRPVIK